MAVASRSERGGAVTTTAVTLLPVDPVATSAVIDRATSLGSELCGGSPSAGGLGDILPIVTSRSTAKHEVSSGTLDGFSDPLLLARIAGQDREAFRVFYHRHSGRLLAALRHLCRDTVMAEDLLQEVFLTVWRKAAGYRADRGDVGGWLFTISRNKVIDRRRRGQLALVDDEGSLLADAAAPAEGGRDMRLSVRQALGTLTIEQRQAVTLTYLGGFTYDETAARLDVPLGTLKSRLRAGIHRLREQLRGA